MAITFPTDPTNGQEFTANGIVYVYDATAGLWDINASSSSTGTSGIPVSDNPPTNPAEGDQWFSSELLETFIYYVDDNGSYWVKSNPSSAVEDIDVPTDINDLTDTSGVIPSDVSDLTDTGGILGAAPPTIISVSPTNYDGSNQTTFTIIGTNFDLGTVVDFITSDGTEYRASATSAVTQGELTALTPQAFLTSDGPLDVKVTTNSGATVTASDVIQTGGAPVWTTPAGTLYENAFADDIASGDNSYRLGNDLNETLVATDPEDQAVTYGIVSGSLPPNGVLNANTGNISGTLPSDIGSDTTYSFLAAAYDQSGNRTDRTFNIIVKNQTGLLYEFSNFIFHSCQVAGPRGPDYARATSSYATGSNPWLLETEFFNVLDDFHRGVQLWKPPISGMYRIEMAGAVGGFQTQNTLIRGGYGAKIIAHVRLESDNVYCIAAGQLPQNNKTTFTDIGTPVNSGGWENWINPSYDAGQPISDAKGAAGHFNGGGGASWIGLYDGSSTGAENDVVGDVPILVAGGGGSIRSGADVFNYALNHATLTASANAGNTGSAASGYQNGAGVNGNGSTIGPGGRNGTGGSGWLSDYTGVYDTTAYTDGKVPQALRQGGQGAAMSSLDGTPGDITPGGGFGGGGAGGWGGSSGGGGYSGGASGENVPGAGGGGGSSFITSDSQYVPSLISESADWANEGYVRVTLL